MKRLLPIVLLTAVIAVSGCTSSQYYVTAGIVTHSNSLEEAYGKCIDICEGMVLDECSEWYDTEKNIKSCFERRRSDLTPRLSECTNQECQCEC